MAKKEKNKGCFFCKHVILAGPDGSENPKCHPAYGEMKYDPLNGWTNHLLTYDCKSKNKKGDCEYFCESGKNALNEYLRTMSKAREQGLL